MNKTLLSILLKPTAETLARKELADAECSLLQARSSVEYSNSMAAYHQSRVNRLKNYLAEANREKAKAADAWLA